MMRTYSFDPVCYELAEHFLGQSASEAAKNDLAQDIQNTVELSTQDDERPAKEDSRASLTSDATTESQQP